MTPLQTIPLNALRESPFNPRQAYPASSLDELAASIRTQGVLQPVLVRPLPGAANGDPWPLYELVCGHRRYRAATLAGLDELPAIVREMTDEQAAVAQLHENAKRADITALEEADGYQHLHRTHHMPVPQIAQAIGKSTSHVYSRLKLATAGPDLREACMRRGLPAELALEVARVPASLQRQALRKITADHADEDTPPADRWLSYRNTKTVLQTAFRTMLSRAVFALDDATLTGAGPCTTCPKRAGNDPELADLPDHTCMDSDCFDAKTIAHQDGHQARQAAQQQSLALPPAQDAPKAGVPAHAPATTVGRPSTSQAGHLAKARPQESATHGWTDAERLTTTEDGIMALRSAVFARVFATPRTVEELRALLDYELHVGDGPSVWELPAHLFGGDAVEQQEEMGGNKWLREVWLPSATADQMGALLVCCDLAYTLLRVNPAFGGKTAAQAVLARCSPYNVLDQLTAAAAAPSPAPTPSTAGAGAAGGGGGQRPALARPAGVRYKCLSTGQSWTGRGLKPAWVKAHLAAGGTLAQIEVKSVTDDAGSAVGRASQGALLEAAGA
jgi:ParB/RepB/Spo0J family partition protein